MSNLARLPGLKTQTPYGDEEIEIFTKSQLTAFDLREHVLNGNVSEKRRVYGQKYDDLVKLANSLDDQSNPVIVIVKK